MKYVLLGSLLLLLLIIFCMWTGWMVEKTIDQTAYYLEQAIDAIRLSGYEDAALFIRQAAAQWELDKRTLGMMLEHDAISHVKLLFMELMHVIETAAPEDMADPCRVLLETLRQIKEQERAKIENIL